MQVLLPNEKDDIRQSVILHLLNLKVILQEIMSKIMQKNLLRVSSMVLRL